MILIDLSQIYHQAVYSYTKNSNEIDEGILRHLVLTKIFEIKKELKKKKNISDEIILCGDGKDYWRKEYFPYYKAGRKKKKEDSELDWEYISSCYNSIREQFKNELPMKYLEVPRCEADDLIYVLSMINPNDRIIIVSNDKDFLQIQNFRTNVKQFCPRKHEFVNPFGFSLFEKILRDESGDGIPNFLSDSDTFVNPEKKQKRLMQKRVDEILKISGGYENPELFCESTIELENFIRNKKLIDLREIPDTFFNLIKETFESLDISKRSWYQFCFKYKLHQINEKASWR